MGLDMYLDRTSDKGRELALYLQKANQVHSWMLRHFDADRDYNCDDKPLMLDKPDVAELLSDMKRVLDNHKLASTVLPTMSGFFFGETDYDKFYFNQLQHTYEELSAISKDIDWEHEWLEYSCWW